MNTSNQRLEQTFGETGAEQPLPMHASMRGPVLSLAPSPSD